MTLTEASFGVIPAKQVDGQWHLLMIQHQAGHWAFPKGRSEEGESPFQTAQRELMEETGLSILRQLHDQLLCEQYHFQREGKTVYKTVTYFLAEVSGMVVLQQDELADFRWISLQDTENQATFPETQKICQNVRELLC